MAKLPKLKNGGSDKKKTRRRKRKESFGIYLFRVLIQAHPHASISTKAIAIMNSLLWDILDRVASEAARIARYNKRPTLSCRELQTAICLIFPGELAKHAVADGVKAVHKYMMSMSPNF
jgi:histone H2B